MRNIITSEELATEETKVVEEKPYYKPAPYYRPEPKREYKREVKQIYVRKANVEEKKAALIDNLPEHVPKQKKVDPTYD